jgi:AbrB family looped-hinge helix DNA binding protein
MPHFAPVSSKGWVVIPKELRERYNIRPGNSVVFLEDDRGLLIVPVPENPVKAFRGMFKDFSLVPDLLKTREEDVAREELRAGQLRGADLPPE